MTIGSGYPQIQGFSEVQAGHIDRLSSAQEINSASDDASGLAIADKLQLHKSSLSQTIDNMNSGIAMSNIAQSGIASQKELLESMRSEILKGMDSLTSTDQKASIQDQIAKYIDQFDNISNYTKYNSEELLKTKGDISDELSVVGEDTIISMEKADTVSISDSLKSFVSDFSSSAAARESLLEKIDEGIDKLASYASDFGSASNAFESSARNAISAEKNTAAAKSTISDIDYAKEVSNFSKTNLQSQIGYLIQTQANAAQNRNITLLS